MLARPADIVFDNEDRLHFSLYQHDARVLFHTRLFDSEWLDTTIVDEQAQVGFQNDMAVDSNGRAHICYLNNDNANIVYASFDGTDWQSEVISSWSRKTENIFSTSLTPITAFSESILYTRVIARTFELDHP